MKDPRRETSLVAACPTEALSGAEQADRLASQVRSVWERGERADVAAVLQANPGLEQYRSVVLDLAVCEYRQRLDRGESLDAESFSRRFPSFQRSLYLLIEVQKLVSQVPGLDELQEAVEWPQPGDSFLGFTLVSELGRGALARVFLAKEPALGNRLVALKVAFQGNQEAEMLGKLQHPNVVPVYSVQEDPGTGLTAVCMPYLGRATLADILDRAFAATHPPHHGRVIVDAVRHMNTDPETPKLTGFERILRKGSYVDGVVHLALQLAEALAFTHSRGICHRDLKPSNVLMSMEGRPLLLDFNLSLDQEVNTGRIGGTLPYMAPEQLQLVRLERTVSPGHADPRSDLYSLGVILYELLSGAHPFGPIPWERPLGQIAQELLERQKRGPTPLQEKNPEVDKRLASLVDQCLAFEADQRPGTARALAESLRRELRPLRRAKRWVRSHRLTVATAAVLLTIALVCAGIAATRESYSERLTRLGQQYAEQGEHEMALECFGEALRLSPDDPTALFARGCAHMRQGKYVEAIIDLKRLDQNEPSAKTKACLGYCNHKIHDYPRALDYHREAIDLGMRTPALLNNLGAAYLVRNRFQEAETMLREALTADEGLQAPHHNLAIVYLQLAFQRQMATRKFDVNPDAVHHVLRAIEIGPPSGDLHFLAACHYFVASEKDAALTSRVIEHLEKAVEYGWNVNELETDPLFVSLRIDPGFKKALSQRVKEQRSRAERLLDPLS